ncbi:MAG: ATP-binding cassette domain-containing protein [Treponemataceae bacterium]
MLGADLRGIRKYFPENGVEALSEISFDLHPGEIHALVGENGAGKSTLMHILSGLIEPSAGTISVDGVERRFDSPAAALRAGIGLVRQHPQTVPGFALWEDCVLGSEPTRLGIIKRSAAREAVRDLSCRWGFDLDPDARTESLAVSQKQKAAVLSLLMRDAKYLLLDEPTAVLAPLETERLFDLLLNLKAAGHGIVLISHKLPETLRVADRVTVLRKGRLVGTRDAAELDADELRSMMFGPAENKKEEPPITMNEEGETALSIRGLTTRLSGRPLLRGIDLDLRRGRILGVAGVRESGLETLEFATAGLIRAESGSIELLGKRIEGRGAKAFREAGGVYVPADRMGIALAPRLSINDNLSVHPLSRAHGFLSPAELWTRSRAVMEAARVAGDPKQTASSFSGGTLQRLILARELAENPDFILFSEPGWGLDAASRMELDRRIKRLARAGKAILLMSTDLDELISLSDSIVTLRDGLVSGRFARTEFTDTEELREAIGAAMIGTEVCLDK